MPYSVSIDGECSASLLLPRRTCHGHQNKHTTSDCTAFGTKWSLIWPMCRAHGSSGSFLHTTKRKHTPISRETVNRFILCSYSFFFFFFFVRLTSAKALLLANWHISCLHVFCTTTSTCMFDACNSGIIMAFFIWFWSRKAIGSKCS